jgi:hypothetical protein
MRFSRWFIGRLPSLAATAAFPVKRAAWVRLPRLPMLCALRRHDRLFGAYWGCSLGVPAPAFYVGDPEGAADAG